jgi:hypothetical protein
MSYNGIDWIIDFCLDGDCRKDNKITLSPKAQKHKVGDTITSKTCPLTGSNN